MRHRVPTGRKHGAQAPETKEKAKARARAKAKPDQRKRDRSQVWHSQPPHLGRQSGATRNSTINIAQRSRTRR